MSHENGTASTSPSPTEILCAWIEQLKYEDIPPQLVRRAKYLMLDGLACGLVGAHLPSSEKAAKTIIDLEGGTGSASVFGWETKIGPISAALLNGTFIQGFELDDWHKNAPVHLNSILIPSLLAAAEHITHADTSVRFKGVDLLLAYIVGCEVGPRVGLGLWGAHVLSTGWHSGAVFGPSASAAAVSKILGLSRDAIEDALGIACTQAGGLMSAQFESEVKRMQHGFAARNGLLGAMLSRGGYIGIKKVYEREYGGFLTMFSGGNGKSPQYKADEVCHELSKRWETNDVIIKPYASMAGTHCTVDVMMALRTKYPELMSNFPNIKSIHIEMSEPAYHHGGWKAARPLTSTGAQMNNAYVAAVYLVDNQVMPAQFRESELDRDEIWNLIDVTTCAHNDEFSKLRQRITVTFKDGSPTVSHEEMAQKGISPPLTEEEILAKWRAVTDGLIDEKRRNEIESLILSLDECDDISAIGQIMKGATKNPLE